LKKIALTLIDILSVLLIVCAVCVLLTVLLTRSNEAPSIFGYSMFRVMTGSMEPAITTDSLIVTHETDPADLEPGDIITFYSSDPMLDGAVNTHRIVSVTQEADGQYVFVTRGDANNVDDHYETRAEDVIGQVVFISHFLGLLIRLLSNPLVFVPIILLPLAVLLIRNLWNTISLARMIAKQEQEQAIRQAVEEVRRRQKQQREQEEKTTEDQTK
jgi:signal peptidase